STSGYCVFLGDNLLSWSTKRQHTLLRSSVEAEYRGVANIVAETAWFRNLLRELHSPLSTATLVYCDNVSAVYMSANPVQHQQTKQIEINFHFIRDMVTAGQGGREGGRGVKEKSLNKNSINTSSGISVSTESDDTMYVDIPGGVASTVKEGVTPSVVDMMVEKEKISSLEDTTVLEFFPPLTTSVSTTAGNAPGKSSYSNITGKPSGKKVNVRTLFTPGGNGIDVVVLVDSIRAISERFANTAYGFFSGKKVAYLDVTNYVRCSN
nr:ribonuclease H-like domain-containing protein [Tanacetum cinerariifolium]